MLAPNMDGFMAKIGKNDIILVINPGSTTTKIALFSGKKKVYQENIFHNEIKIKECMTIWDQFDLRLETVKVILKNYNIEQLNAVVGRGGLLKPVERGTYEVNETMLKDARNGVQGEHVSNLGCALAYEIANIYGCTSYIVDPVSVDEFIPIARLSGHPLIERRSLSHALNLRAAALWGSDRMSKNIADVNFIVVHLGGGISVAAVCGGRIIDVNDASSAGPFSPERSGSLPLQQFINLCFSGEFSKEQIKRMISGNGGLKAYLGTSDLVEIEKKINKGCQKEKMVFNAMIYQICKEIGAFATSLKGHFSAIILTGGLAFSKMLVNAITERISFLSPVWILPGEREMEAMALGVLRIFEKKESLKTYI